MGKSRQIQVFVCVFASVGGVEEERVMEDECVLTSSRLIRLLHFLYFVTNNSQSGFELCQYTFNRVNESRRGGIEMSQFKNHFNQPKWPFKSAQEGQCPAIVMFDPRDPF
jgi:hypothetical protein